MSNQETIFVSCATNKPTVIISHNIPAGNLSKDFCVVLQHSQAWEQALSNGDLVKLDLFVLDEATSGNLNYILAIGEDAPGPEYYPICDLHYHYHDSVKSLGVAEVDPLVLRPLTIYGLTEEVKFNNSEPDNRQTPRRSKREEAELSKARAKELVRKHLDDVIAQAHILKETDDPLVQGDAFSRMNFAVASITRLKMGNYGENRRDGRRGPDVIYRASTDSHYTPEGEFIETRDQATARAWFGDASHRSMERLQRKRERDEDMRAREEDRLERRRAFDEDMRERDQDKRDQFWNESRSGRSR